MSYFLGQWFANADTICDSKTKATEFKRMIASEERCSKSTVKKLLTIGNEIGVCERLGKALDQMNIINGVYKPKTFNEWLSANDLDDLPTFQDFVRELKAWHKRECYPNGTVRVRRDLNAERN